MVSIAVYHKTVPNNKNPEKNDLLRFFADGARVSGETVVDVYDHNTVNLDIAMIQGWLGEGPVIANHLQLRNRVIKNQLARKKYVVTADSNLFLYANTKNDLHYLRYSFNGVFPNTGIYCDNEIDPRRWAKISKDLNISLKDYKTNGNHILLCLQRNGGWSMGNVDIQDWTSITISEIRKHTDRPIIIRPHPGDRTSKNILQPHHPQCRIKFSKAVKLSTNENILDDLKDCWTAVNYNSSPVVAAAIEGIPIFVSDPIKSQCGEIANTNLSTIENPKYTDRQKWVERLSMFHWNFSELKSGECWQHMRKYIK